MKRRRVFIFLFITIGTFVVFISYNSIPITNITPAYDYFIANFKKDTGALNAVTAIYLNYRIFDTFFEALLLLLSVIAVIYFSWGDKNEI